MSMRPLLALLVLTSLLLAACGGSSERPVDKGSPSDRILTFAARRDNSSDVYAVDLVTHELRLLVKDAESPSWSPDGRLLAFVRDDDVYVRPAQGGPARLLARNSGPVTWSADSSAVFVDGVTRISADGSDRERFVTGFDPAPSPDGRRLAFKRGDSLDPSEVWVAEGDGGGARLVTGVAACSALVWSADGSRLAFADPSYATDSAYSGRLEEIDPKTGHADAVTSRLVNCDPPLWSPGRKLAVTVDIKSKFLVGPFVVGANVATAAALRHLPGLKPLAWSPTGRWLAVGGEGVAVVDTRTGYVDRPTTAERFGYEVTSARWHPTARRIAVLGGQAVTLGTVPTTSIAGSNTLDTTRSIALTAADRDALAIVYADGENCIELWTPRTRQVTRFNEDSCLGIDGQAVDAIALAGRRLTWVDSMQTLHYDIGLMTAQPSAPAPKGVFGDLDAWGHGGIAAAGTLCVFVRWRDSVSDVLRVDADGVGKLRTEPGHARILDVEGGRIVLAGRGRISVVSGSGSLLAEFPDSGHTAYLDGDRLAVQSHGAVAIYSVGTRALLRRLALAHAELMGFAGGVLAYRSPGRIELLRLSDGKRAEISVKPGPDLNVELTPAGLFHAKGMHAEFVPFAQLFA